MSLRCRVSIFSLVFATFLFSAFFAPFSEAQQPTGAGKALTVERIYSQPSLSGRLTRGLAWTPDGKELSYFETKGSGKEAKTELWVMDAVSGERRLLIAADKLEAILPADTSRPTQATGLGRRAPSQYQWAPDSSAIAYLEMDEHKVSQYPLVDFSSPTGEAEMERYPPAGGANPVVRVFVVSLNGGEPRALDTGAETDIYIPRVNWLTDSKH